MQPTGQRSQTVVQVAQTVSEPIGRVENVTGQAAIVRTDGSRVEASQGLPVYQGDVVETGEIGHIGILFADDTTFALGSQGRMTLDEMVYDPGEQSGDLAVSVAEGVFSFVSGQVAETGPQAMTIDTPVATIGVRGTTGYGIAGAEGETGSITLGPDPDGNLGEIVLSNDSGRSVVLNQPFATSQVSSGFLPPTAPAPVDPGVIGRMFGEVRGALPGPPPPLEDLGDEDGDGSEEASGAAFDEALGRGADPRTAFEAAALAGGTATARGDGDAATAARQAVEEVLGAKSGDADLIGGFGNGERDSLIDLGGAGPFGAFGGSGGVSEPVDAPAPEDSDETGQTSRPAPFGPQSQPDTTDDDDDDVVETDQEESSSSNGITHDLTGGTETVTLTAGEVDRILNDNVDNTLNTVGRWEDGDFYRFTGGNDTIKAPTGDGSDGGNVFDLVMAAPDPAGSGGVTLESPEGADSIRIDNTGDGSHQTVSITYSAFGEYKDRITGFDPTTDTIGLNGAGGGGGTFQFVKGSNPTPSTADPHFLLDTDDNTLSYDRDGNRFADQNESFPAETLVTFTESDFDDAAFDSGNLYDSDPQQLG